jgi:hypothetical protein
METPPKPGWRFYFDDVRIVKGHRFSDTATFPNEKRLQALRWSRFFIANLAPFLFLRTSTRSARRLLLCGLFNRLLFFLFRG